MIERRLFGKKIDSFSCPDDPIFIIGHWRTGTTLLHQMMSLDPNLAAPTLFQVAEPECFISSHQYYRPLFSVLVSVTRPMDNVKIGMDEPQEDEYAIYRLTDFSPIERLVFPKDQCYFPIDYPSFVPLNEKERKEWDEALCGYFRKLNFVYRKTIVSKNPFNSMRIKVLVSLFPRARFIHIVRHPYEVVPSTINMWKIVIDQNKLNRKGSIPGIDEVSKGYEKLLKVVKNDSVVIPDGNFVEIKFEDLEADPINEIRKIYNGLQMPFDELFHHRLETFMDSLKTYKKNVFHLTESEKEMIRKHLNDQMQICNYQ
jgi:hypothetical protein